MQALDPTCSAAAVGEERVNMRGHEKCSPPVNTTLRSDRAFELGYLPGLEPLGRIRFRVVSST